MVTVPLLSSVDIIREALTSLLNRFLLAALVLLIGFIAGKLLGKFTEHLLHGVELDKAMNTALNVGFPFEEVAGKAVSYLIYFATVILALDALGVDTLIFTVISAGIILLFVLSAGLALRDMIPNLIAGLIIHRKKTIIVGDNIKIDGTEGEVVKVEMLETHLRTPAGDDLFVPNASLVKKGLVRKKRN